MVYRLEERVLFDAALPVDTAEVVEAVENVDEVVETAEGVVESAAVVVEDGECGTESDLAVVLEELISYEHDTSGELYLIDTSVQGYQEIVESLPEHAQVELIRSADDLGGLLSEYENLDAVHVISHGSEGTLILAGEHITADNVGDFSDEFSEWNKSLAAEADILFYGCNSAASGNGELLIEQIGALTGADIAASTNSTGVDGDWELEFTTGTIEAAELEFEGVDYNLENRTLLVTTAADESGTALGDLTVDGDGNYTAASLSLREAVSIAGGDTSNTYTIEFSDSVFDADDGTIDSITLGSELLFNPSGATTVTVDGDSDGDGDADVVIKGERFKIVGGTNEHTIIRNMNFDGTGSDNEAIYMNNAGDKTLSNVAISSTGAHSIKIASGVRTAIIENSSVQASSSQGININSGANLRISISGTSISASGTEGIYYGSVDGAQVTLSSSTLSGNGDDGIQMLGDGGQLLITGSTISSNSKRGVYIDNDSSPTVRSEVVVINSTIAENDTADANNVAGLEVTQDSMATVALFQSTVMGQGVTNTNGTQGVKFKGENQTFIYQNSVIAENNQNAINNAKGTDSGSGGKATLVDLGGNVTSNGSADVGLTSLGNNGGTVKTVGLDSAVSGLIDSGAAQLELYHNETDGYYYKSGSDYYTLGSTSSFTPTNPASDRVSSTADQRGVSRSDGSVDIGAVEYDGIAPTLSASLPADDATGVALADVITLTFNETVSIEDASGITLHLASDDSKVAATVTLNSGTKTVTITPDSDLANGTGYYVKVSNTAVEDIAGNSYAGIADATALSFTTIAAGVNTAPTSGNATVDAAEDTTYTFDASDFPFTDVDSGDTLQLVEIVTAPASGILDYNGTTIDAAYIAANGPVTIAVTDITAGQLTYEPVANSNSDLAASPSFSFKVSDGEDLTVDSSTMTIDIASVADNATGTAKVVAGDGSDLTGTVSAGDVLKADISAISDPDGITNITYQWKYFDVANNQYVNISGAQSVTYTVDDAYAGTKVTVQARVYDTHKDNNGGGVSHYKTANNDSGTINALPAVTSPSFAISEGESKVITNTDLGIADPDTADSVTVAVSEVTGGYFDNTNDVANAGDSSDAVSSFTLADLNSGYIQFVHDGGEAAPAFKVTANDGTVDSTTESVAVTFTNLDDPATDTPVNTGTLEQREVQNTSVNSIADSDGTEQADYTYQWQRGVDTNLSGTIDSGEWNTIVGATDGINTSVELYTGAEFEVQQVMNEIVEQFQQGPAQQNNGAAVENLSYQQFLDDDMDDEFLTESASSQLNSLQQFLDSAADVEFKVQDIMEHLKEIDINTYDLDNDGDLDEDELKQLMKNLEKEVRSQAPLTQLHTLEAVPRTVFKNSFARSLDNFIDFI